MSVVLLGCAVIMLFGAVSSFGRFQQQRINYSVFRCGKSLDENKMTLDEIKAELDMRSVNYEDCISRSEIVQRLLTVRAMGRADPTIIDNFNDEKFQKDLQADLNMLDTDIVDEVVARDGTLPGGLSPELMKMLASDEVIMTLLKDPKMQDIMKAVMTSGPDAMKKYMYDPDAVKLLELLRRNIEKLTNSKM